MARRFRVGDGASSPPGGLHRVRTPGAWGDVAPTGRRATFSGVNIFRFGDEGKVVEIWNHRDDFGLNEQLGALVFAAAPPQAEER